MHEWRASLSGLAGWEDDLKWRSALIEVRDRFSSYSEPGRVDNRVEVAKYVQGRVDVLATLLEDSV